MSQLKTYSICRRDCKLIISIKHLQFKSNLQNDTETDIKDFSRLQ